MTRPATGSPRLDVAIDEFVNATIGFAVHTARILGGVSMIDGAYQRLISAAENLESARAQHAADAIHGTSANYDDEQIADMLKGMCG